MTGGTAPPARSDALAWLRARPSRLAITLALLTVMLGAALAYIVWRTSLPALGLYLIPLVGCAATGAILAFYAPQRTYQQPSPPQSRASWLLAWVFLAAITLAALTLLTARLEKPPAFYIAFAIATFALIALAATCRADELHLGLVMAAAAGAITLFGVATHALTPTSFGADAPFHRGAAAALIETGRVGSIVSPYSSFAAYQIGIAAFVDAGVPMRWAVPLMNALATLAAVIAVALFTQRAFGTRAAMLASGLLAVGTGFLSLSAALSPSKAGIWTVLFLGFLLAEGSALAAIAGLGLAFAGFLYHPVIGLGAVLVMSAYFLVFSVAQLHVWLPPLARLVGFPRAEGPRRLMASHVSVPAILVVLIIVAGWISVREPNLTRAIAAILAFRGDQSGAIGVVRLAAPTLAFVTQTFTVNFAAIALLIPATYVVINTYLSPERSEALFLVTMLAGVLGFLTALTAAGLFLLGPERFLMLQETLLVAAGAGGLALLVRSLSTPRAWTIAGVVLLAFCAANVTSYRVDGNDLLSSEIPKQTDQTTVQLKSMVASLRPHLSASDTMVMEGYASRASSFPSHSEATFYNDPVPRFSMGQLGAEVPPAGTLYAGDEYGAERAHDTERWERISAENDILYDNGEVILGRFA